MVGDFGEVERKYERIGEVDGDTGAATRGL